MLHFELSCLAYQKRGNFREEYEDAYASWPIRRYNREVCKTFRLAVADGAAEGAFSGNWARLLVDDYVRNPYVQRATMLRRGNELSVKWRDKVWKPDLPWYTENKIALGSFSTLLGFRIYKDSGIWNAIVVGDSCLFQVRDDSILLAWPIADKEEFTRSPILLSTLDRGLDKVKATISVIERTAQKNDVFLLMTDAMGAWFLDQSSLGNRPWAELMQFSEDFKSWEFTKWVDDQRSKNRLRNDDVTCVMCRIYEN